MNIFDSYKEWLLSLIPYQSISAEKYTKLINHLHSKEFEWVIDMDRNRAIDGISLRYRFAWNKNVGYEEIDISFDNVPCSIFEMMVALAKRCEENIMLDSDYGDRTGYWFWEMVANMHLGRYDDDNYDAEEVEEIVDRMLFRLYSPNGDGGLFTVNNGKDMRREEIWCQLMGHLHEILN